MAITKGIVKEPKFIIVYGTEGIGKTQFAASAPDPVFLDPEFGSKGFDVARETDVKSFIDIMNFISSLKNEKYKTLVIDSLDHIEPIVWKHVCDTDEKKPDNIEDAAGGFQKGYGVAIEYWRQMISALRDLRATKGMNIVCLAHSKIVTVNHPSKPTPYERFTLKLHENRQCSASALWKESVDAVLFAAYDDVIFKVNDKDKRGKATGGVRKIYTTRNSSWDAKNRYGLPEELALSYQAFSDAVDAGQPDSLDVVQRDIKAILGIVSEKDKNMHDRIAKAATDAGNDITKLVNIRNHARVIAEQGV